MIKAHPYRAVLTVLGVMAVCVFVSGMIGQYNDGPWGGLPQWLGAVTWFGFLISALVMLVLTAYLVVQSLKWRKANGHGEAHPA